MEIWINWIWVKRKRGVCRAILAIGDSFSIKLSLIRLSVLRWLSKKSHRIWPSPSKKTKIILSSLPFRHAFKISWKLRVRWFSWVELARLTLEKDTPTLYSPTKAIKKVTRPLMIPMIMQVKIICRKRICISKYTWQRIKSQGLKEKISSKIRPEIQILSKIPILKRSKQGKMGEILKVLLLKEPQKGLIFCSYESLETKDVTQ